jgi:3-hydroxy acid dehydrogenase / malonic semialdehyde reductase
MQKTILVTGATSGFGKAITYLFASHQYNIIITGRRQERLFDIAQELNKLYPNIQIQTLCFDIRNRAETILQLSNIDKVLFPTIDILVNNAGLAAGLGTIDEGSYDDWDAMIDTNVKGLLTVSREIIPIMQAQNFGHIINISSTAGKTVYPRGNVYCATKHAVDALSQAMRIDLLANNIKVTSINPGAAETEFSIVRFKGDQQKAKAVYDGFTPLYATDIANTVYYVATLPPSVCINDLTITCTTQANSHYSIKKV